MKQGISHKIWQIISVESSYCVTFLYFFFFSARLLTFLFFSLSIHCNVSSCTWGFINFHHEIYVFVIFVKYTFSKMVWDNVWFSFGVVKFHTYAESIGKVKKRHTLYAHRLCMHLYMYICTQIYLLDGYNTSVNEFLQAKHARRFVRGSNMRLDIWMKCYSTENSCVI